MRLKFLHFTLIISCFCTAVMAQTSTSTSTVQLPPDVAQLQRGYTLGPGDEIEVTVLGEKDFSGRMTVDEDGKIEPPFTNKAVVAKCRTERELRIDVAQAYTRYLRNPQVSLQVTKKVSRPPAVVDGAVKIPGRVELGRRVSLQEFLAFAGGTTEEAGSTVQVWHTQPVMCSESGEDTTASTDAVGVPFNVYKLSDLRDGKVNSNPLIRPGDLVVVQKAPQVYLTGEVLFPKAIFLRDGMTLNTAIANVGGVNPKSKTKDIKIYRLKPDSNDRAELSFNLDDIKKGKQNDVQLQPYDIIQVDKAPKTFKDVLLGIATGGISSFTQSAPTRLLY